MLIKSKKYAFKTAFFLILLKQKIPCLEHGIFLLVYALGIML